MSKPDDRQPRKWRPTDTTCGVREAPPHGSAPKIKFSHRPTVNPIIGEVNETKECDYCNQGVALSTRGQEFAKPIQKSIKRKAILNNFFFTQFYDQGRPCNKKRGLQQAVKTQLNFFIKQIAFGVE